MKRLLLFIMVMLLSNTVYSQEVADIKLDMRTYSGFEIPAGVMIPVLNMQEISTETCPVGYKVKFVSTNDLYIDDTNVIPEDSSLYGYIEKINEPVVGTNASMRVKVTKLVLPDGYEMPIKAYVYTANGNLIGGELTPPAEWVKMPHYQDKFQKTAWNYRGPTLQIRPGGYRSMGVHTKISAGERELIILVAPLNITHTVAD